MRVNWNERAPACLFSSIRLILNYFRGDACLNYRPKQSATNVYATKREKVTHQRVTHGCQGRVDELKIGLSNTTGGQSN